MTVQELRKILKQVPFNVLLGMRLRRVHRDGITLECTVRDELRNSAGLAHGGVAAALADAAVGCAIQAHFKGGRRITTVEMKINYFLPVKEGCMVARSHLLRIGSSLCVGSVDLRDDTGRLV
ncbi:MAG TPA: PaaI family thioesterase, partial [Terriglobales bacterium]|nr:PaaI family thioesterase [Terriglobales bacterium]